MRNYQRNNTIIIFGYNQTTIADARLLVLDNGNSIRSIYQKSYFEPHRIIKEHNYGERLQTEKHLKYPELGEVLEMLKHKYLSFDEIQEMFTDAGYKGKARTFFDEKYLHLEYLE